MEKELEYSFDDEKVSRFCYDLDNKKIEVHFTGYYDIVKDVYVDASCVWVLENWEYAKCKIGDGQKLYDLSVSMGIFTIILYMSYNDNNELEMLVNTVDNRYLTLFFKDPKIEFNVK